MIKVTLILVDIILLGAIGFGLLMFVKNFLPQKKKGKEKKPVGFFHEFLHPEEVTAEVTAKKK